MKFIVKLFPEITIKSQSVRLRFIKILAGSIRNILREYDAKLAVVHHWDHIEVRSKDESQRENIRDSLTRIPGIHHILEVKSVSYTTMHDICEHVLSYYGERLEGKSFCVRVKRRGKHNFSSQDVERYVGGTLNQHIKSAYVDLSAPEEMVKLEINDDILTLVMARYQGLGGFPVGTQEDVLSLISGGFDSSVASYMFIRRGCRVHYCFFNLGGIQHELGVKKTAYYLWSHYARSHRVRFISIDFSSVVSEILQKIDDGCMGVVLKRMMVRAASLIAERHGIQALVTGEALGQVSSQTLTNLRNIDEAVNTLILRPLITYDKEKIITIAREIGTEDFAKTMPEFCGVISKNPNVKLLKSKILYEEQKFDFSLLNYAVEYAVTKTVKEIIEDTNRQIPFLETVTGYQPNEVILDIRAPDEYENSPLILSGIDVIHVPFYKLNNSFSELDQDKIYLLYCQKGVMSRLQALYLLEKGFTNVKIYHPVS